MSLFETPSKPSPTEVEAELRRLVRQHKVYWEVRPEPVLDGKDKVVQTGFQLALRGTFEHPGHPLVTDPECVEVYRDLRKIAEGLLAAEDADPSYRISVFENAIEYTPSSGRKDIEVTIKIVSRESRHSVDEGELAAVREMKHKLEELGAPRGRWRENAAGAA
jgi:hypothetical protein